MSREGDLNDYFINTANYNLYFSVYIFAGDWSTRNDCGVRWWRSINSYIAYRSCSESPKEKEVTQ